MKIKTDHVTNSSCASFVIQKKNLTNIQIFLINNHLDFIKQYHPSALSYNSYLGKDDMDDITSTGWNITEKEDTIEGETMMDNFDMLGLLAEIGVDEDHIEYHGCY